ncbi:hypothetical protein HCH_05518 [Hahella chejuensis KCTC 2396]|uniref:Uncharacterized protein n=1 Tax=Hahella chejuensis (strain KCTC 2396) TaxID=349521 RepID=Q2SAZ4_HAHCH|nr:hypothetical protein HCH_05518 [Hahella chejuensis KCTC 2396]
MDEDLSAKHGGWSPPKQEFKDKGYTDAEYRIR